jgi:predicted Ser/Thr protein kinase
VRVALGPEVIPFLKPNLVSPQSTIAHYRIVCKLGEGGMGTVYRATDTKLNRDVAIKILPAAFAADPDRLARFTREAQVLASLNHPNIAAIYGVEDRAIVMELVEGKNLAGPLPMEQALAIIHQLIDALEYAHERGIVHRDLKPANIRLAPEGRVKVLDFGLAKAMSAGVAAGDPAVSPTLTMRSTVAGVIMGTAAYMAPEQARGQDVDKRADIWAFGVVVYEMLTGRKLFEGPTMSDTLAAVLTKQPDLASAPPKVRRLLELCLTHDVRQRLRDISGARVALDQPVVEAPRVSSNIYRWTSIALALTVIAASAGLWRALHGKAGDAPRPLMRLSVDLGPDATTGPGITAAISPDGSRIAYPVRTASGFQLALRALSQPKGAILPGTSEVYFPFFSPDSQWIGLFTDGKLKKMSINGGASSTLAVTPIPRGGAWSADGTIIVCDDGQRLAKISDSGGGSLQAITKPGPDEVHRWPQILPGSQDVLFTSSGLGDVDFENASIAVVSLKTGQIRVVQRGGYFGRYLPGGYLIYVHEGTLLAARFDLSRMATEGAPVALVDDVAGNAAWGGGNLDVSDSGTLVYLSGKYEIARPLVWMDSAGSPVPYGSVAGLSFRLSPDGTRLALMVKSDIEVYDPRSEASTRITFSETNRQPVWTPDGKHVVYARAGGGLMWTRSDGSGHPEQILANEGSPIASSFSPDGKRLAYHRNGDGTNRDIWTLPLDLSDPEHPKPGTPEVIVATPGTDVDARFSLDGRFLAYTSNETGEYRVFVKATSGPGLWQVSASPARFPIWSRDGKQLFFVSTDAHIMVVDYTVKGATFSAGKSRQWSNKPIWMTGNYPSYDVSPDGKRVLTSLNPNTETSVHVTFLLNFFDELRRRLP